LDSLQQFLALLQPCCWVRGTLEIPNYAILIHDDGGSALNPNEVLFQSKAMIDRAFWIGQDREWRFERLSIPAGTIQYITENNQNLHPGFDKFIVHAPQLGDMGAALDSVVLTHEEKDDFLATIIGKRNLAVGI
jgi:hypothetical protein